MGITLSHTLFAPISLVSTIIGFVSFAFTLGTFIKVFWTNLGTFAAAPHEITDFLSNTKQGLLEERRHLKRVKRRRKSLMRDQSHGQGRRGSGYDDNFYYHDDNEEPISSNKSRSRGRRGSKKSQMHFDRSLQSIQSAGEDAALKALRITIHDLMKSFQELEHPFLKSEYQAMPRNMASSASPSRLEKSGHYAHDSDHELHGANRFGYEYRSCGMKQRWLWVRRKADVVHLNEMLSRLEIRRMAHEVGEIYSLLWDVGRDLEDVRGAIGRMENRLGRVVGVRRVE